MTTSSPSATSAALCQSAEALAAAVDACRFTAPVHTVYNPLRYAWPAHRAYLEAFGATPKKAVFLGMNPGPWGMAQTGVPFGEISAVRDWMGIAAEIAKPPREHAKRPIEGFACKRSEVSGRRLWGLFAERFGTAEAFFAEYFVANYCPLVFMSETGANITPDKLPAAARAPLEAACDRHLAEIITTLRPAWLIGVGAFAGGRAKRVAEAHRLEVRIGTLLHPSPASPVANREWPLRPLRQMRDLGLWE